MKILLVHNYYKISGGEDSVLQNETKLLTNNGNNVKQHTIDNAGIDTIWAKFWTLLNVPFSFAHYKKMKRALVRNKPDVVHIHNYFPLYSPSIFYACKSEGIPVVHTLHNYRAVCPTALLMHEGKINEKSLRGTSWWAVPKKIYRNSFVGSLALAGLVELHKGLKTWHCKVDRFIALTEFSRQKYIEAGWPAAKIVVKPNFIEDPFHNIECIDKKGGYALYVGRLSEEKGIDILFESWKDCTFPLKIIGDGALKKMRKNNEVSSIEYLGKKDKQDVLDLVKNADFIIMPSKWYEGFPMVLVEAFACGTPALVSRLGSMETIIDNEITGLHFEAGDSTDLANKVQSMIDNPNKTREMGCNARKEYLSKYTPEKNHAILIDIYQQAIAESKGS